MRGEADLPGGERTGKRGFFLGLIAGDAALRNAAFPPHPDPLPPGEREKDPHPGPLPAYRAREKIQALAKRR